MVQIIKINKDNKMKRKNTNHTRQYFKKHKGSRMTNNNIKLKVDAFLAMAMLTAYWIAMVFCFTAFEI